jgi:hypothetical protein
MKYGPAIPSLTIAVHNHNPAQTDHTRAPIKQRPAARPPARTPLSFSPIHPACTHLQNRANPPLHKLHHPTPNRQKRVSRT